MPVYREAKTLYFLRGGAENTQETLLAAFERARELNISHVVVASSSGKTGLTAIKLGKAAGYKGQLVVVGQHFGYHRPGVQEMSPKRRQLIEARGVPVFIGSHALSGITRSFRLKWQGIEMLEVIAEAYRRVSRGFKVCIECAIMAADAGLVPVDKDIVAVAGSGGGADSAIVLRAAHMNNFFGLKIRELIALPLLDDEEAKAKKGKGRKRP